MQFFIKTPVEQLDTGLYVKCENFQNYGSYKIRGISRLFNNLDLSQLDNGFVTISAGNMARALAGAAKQFNVAVTAFIPETTPAIKVNALEELGCHIIKKSFSDIWLMVNLKQTPNSGYLVHPLDFYLLDGYGSIADEIIAVNPNIDVLVIPYGCGGLLLGIARRLKQLRSPIKIIAAESSHARPLSEAIVNNAVVTVERKPSIVDAIGAPTVLKDAFLEVKSLVSDLGFCEEAEVINCIKNIYNKKKYIIEGAAAVALEVAKKYKLNNPKHNVLAILSGGNFDIRFFQSH